MCGFYEIIFAVGSTLDFQCLFSNKVSKYFSIFQVTSQFGDGPETTTLESYWVIISGDPGWFLHGILFIISTVLSEKEFASIWSSQMTYILLRMTYM